MTALPKTIQIIDALTFHVELRRIQEPGCSPVVEAEVTAMILPGGTRVTRLLTRFLVDRCTLADVADRAVESLRNGNAHELHPVGRTDRTDGRGRNRDQTGLSARFGRIMRRGGGAVNLVAAALVRTRDRSV